MNNVCSSKFGRNLQMKVNLFSSQALKVWTKMMNSKRAKRYCAAQLIVLSCWDNYTSYNMRQ